MINILLNDANDNLSGKKELIGRAARAAEEYAFPRLKIDWDIDVLFEKYLYDMILFDDMIGGRIRSRDFVEISIRGDGVTEDLLAEILVFYLCHAARRGKNDEFERTLFYKLVDEGILPENWGAKEMGIVAKNLPNEVYADCIKEEPEIVKQIDNFGKIVHSIVMGIARTKI